MTYLQSTPPNTHAWVNIPTTKQGSCYAYVAEENLRRRAAQKDAEAKKVAKDARVKEEQHAKEKAAAKRQRRLMATRVWKQKQKEKANKEKERVAKQLKEHKGPKSMSPRSTTGGHSRSAIRNSSPAGGRDSTGGVHGRSRGMPPNEDGGTVGVQVAAQVEKLLASRGLGGDQSKEAVEQCKRLRQQMQDIEREAKRQAREVQRDAKLDMRLKLKEQEELFNMKFSEQKQAQKNQLEEMRRERERAEERHAKEQRERQPPTTPQPATTEPQPVPGKLVADQAGPHPELRHCKCPQPCLPDNPEGGMDKPVCLLCNTRLCWRGTLKGMCTCQDPMCVPNSQSSRCGLELLCGKCGSFLSTRKREQLHRPPSPLKQAQPTVQPVHITEAMAWLQQMAGGMQYLPMGVSPNMQLLAHYMQPPPDPPRSRVQEILDEPRQPTHSPVPELPPQPPQEPQPAAKPAQPPAPPGSPGQQSSREGRREKRTPPQSNRGHHGRDEFRREKPRKDSHSSSGGGRNYYRRRKKRSRSRSSSGGGRHYRSRSRSRSSSSNGGRSGYRRHRRGRRHSSVASCDGRRHREDHGTPTKADGNAPPVPPPMQGAPQCRGQVTAMGPFPPPPAAGLPQSLQRLPAYRPLPPGLHNRAAFAAVPQTRPTVLYLPVQ